MKVATYRRGPHFLVGYTNLPLTVRGGALCVDTGSDGLTILLVFRRRLVRAEGDHILYDGHRLVPGTSARLATVGPHAAFRGTELPPGFGDQTILEFVVH